MYVGISQSNPSSTGICWELIALLFSGTFLVFHQEYSGWYKLNFHCSYSQVIMRNFLLWVLVQLGIFYYAFFWLKFSSMPLYIVQPNTQSRSQKEGSETDQFWSLLGGKSEYSSQKMVREVESDPHLFSCILSKGNQ